MKKIVSVLMTVVILLSVTVSEVFAQTPAFLESGTTAVEKMTELQIRRMFDTDLNVENTYDKKPVTAQPYSLGKISRDAMDKALYLMNAFRQMAGLKPVKLSQDLCELSQYGAVVLAANNQLSHFPGCPAGMDQNFYQLGRKSTSSSNIACVGTTGNCKDMISQSVKMYMDDSDQSNISCVGHRRWMLNPEMGKTGFGCADTRSGYFNMYYSTLYSFDMSVPAADFQFIGWPSSGSFPNNYFDPDTAWSVNLNPARYQIPRMEDLTIRIEGGGKSRTLSGRNTYSAADSTYMNVETSGYGYGQNAIIFRPNMGNTPYQGSYTVTIDGIKNTAGVPVDFAYQVDFFDLNKEPSGGWKQEDDGRWYYLDGYGHRVANQWKRDTAGWCYLDADGYQLQNGWRKDGRSWCYVKDGYRVSGVWQKDGGGWCYLKPDGHMLTNGWAKDSRGWCYLGADGHMLKNRWAKDSGGWCYLDGNGYLLCNGYAWDSAGRHYLNGSGHMAW